MKCRAVFISDVHLGNANSRATELLDFLEAIEADTLYLLGDIIDLWKLSERKGRWRREHQQVLDTLIRKARAGTRVVYVPGNHDPFFRHLAGETLGPIEIHHEATHETGQGLRLLLLHGDRFDQEIRVSPVLMKFGDLLYESCSTANRWLNRFRAHRGLPYWSLANALKVRSKKVRLYVRRFERRVSAYAREQGADGVVCGHIHQARLTRINGVIYANDGDWMESCTGLIETENGHLELLAWPHREMLATTYGVKSSDLRSATPATVGSRTGGRAVSG